jgi:hypothetical protein
MKRPSVIGVLCVCLTIGVVAAASAAPKQGKSGDLIAANTLSMLKEGRRFASTRSETKPSGAIRLNCIRQSPAASWEAWGTA